MTQNKRLILEFINDNLEYGDVKKVANELGVELDTVSKVKNNKRSSKRILKALEAVAMKNRQHALRVTEFNKQPTL